MLHPFLLADPLSSQRGTSRRVHLWHQAVAAEPSLDIHYVLRRHRHFPTAISPPHHWSTATPWSRCSLHRALSFHLQARIYTSSWHLFDCNFNLPRNTQRFYLLLPGPLRNLDSLSRYQLLSPGSRPLCFSSLTALFPYYAMTRHSPAFLGSRAIVCDSRCSYFLLSPPRLRLLSLGVGFSLSASFSPDLSLSAPLFLSGLDITPRNPKT